MEQPTSSATKSTKVETIFEQLAQLENRTFSLRAGSKAIKEKLLGSIPPSDCEKAEKVTPDGILNSIMNQLGIIQDNIQFATDFLADVQKEIEKK